MLSSPLIKKILTNWYVPFLLDSNFLHCLKLFLLPDLLISIGSLFHNDGPLYDVTHYSNHCSILLRVALTFEKMNVYLCYWVQKENKFH